MVDDYTFRVTAAERAALARLADHVRLHRGRFEWTLDDVLRFCLEETNKRFGLGAWPIAPGTAGGTEPMPGQGDIPSDTDPVVHAASADQPALAPKRERKRG